MENYELLDLNTKEMVYTNGGYIPIYEMIAISAFCAGFRAGWQKNKR